MITFINKLVDSGTRVVHFFTNLLTFLLSKHFIGYDRQFISLIIGF